jgi:hypothetical protein
VAPALSNASVLTTGADFMKIPSSGRAAAMGDSLIALVDDIDALNINVGALALLDRIQFMYDHTEWVNGTGVRFESLGFGSPLKTLLPAKMLPGTVGVTIQMLYMSPFQEFNDWGVEVGSDLKYSAFKMKVGYGLPVFRNDVFIVNAGANLSFISTTPSGKGIVKPSLDIGGLAVIRHGQTSLRNIIGDTFRAGLLVQNVDFYSSGVNNNLPLLIKFGFGAKVYQLVDVDLDFSKYLDDSLFQGSLGLEYWLKDLVAFRIGGKLGADQMGFFNAGLGFRYKIQNYRIALDYAFLPYGDVGFAHKIVLKADVAKIEIQDRTDTYYYKGVDYFLNRQYPEALDMWEKVLRKNPGHEEAKKRIEETRKIMKLEEQQRELKKLELDPMSGQTTGEVQKKAP